MLRVTLGWTLALLLVVGTAWAGQKTNGTVPNNTNQNQKYTQNQNHNYTRNQIQKWVDEFNTKNTNKDGKLTWVEFKGNTTDAKQITKLQQVWKTMDTKNYGYVTLEQYKTYWMKTNYNNTTNTTNTHNTKTGTKVAK